MKKILIHFNTFIIFVLTILFIFFIEFEIEIRPNNIITNLEKINYYQKAYSNILQEFDYVIVNNELKDEIINYYTFDNSKKDINLIVRGNNIDHYYEIKEIVSKYSKDEKVIYKYSKEINDLINKNIFMIDEYHTLNKFYLNIFDCIYIIIIFIIIQMILIIINYFLSKNFSFIKIILLSSSIFIGLPKLFINLSGIINNFTYGNKYFSELLIFGINNYINELFIYSIAGIVFVICLNDFVRKYCK